MDYGLLFILLACAFGVFMTWGIGANDLANIMSPTMGSKAVTIKQAMLIAIIFEFAGAFLGSGDVTHTIRSGIINTDMLANNPSILVYGMLAVLLAGSIWMLLASYFGLPVSITNAIIGAIVGFGSVVLGLSAIHWQEVSFIAISWLTSPTIAGITAYVLFISVQRLILSKPNPYESAKRYLPFYLFIVGIILAYMTLLKGLKHFEINVSLTAKLILVLLSGLLVMAAGTIAINRIPFNPDMNRRNLFAHVEKMFGVLMALTACAMVFAHGSNDVAIAVGPMTVVIGIVEDGGKIIMNHQPYNWIVFLGSSGVVIGLLMYGKKVIETVGSGITALTPSRAFAATLAAATTVVVSTSTGIPVSATQTLVGAVLGVGLARGIGALNLHVIRNIFMSWIITLPAASLLAVTFFYFFKWIFVI